MRGGVSPSAATAFLIAAALTLGCDGGSPSAPTALPSGASTALAPSITDVSPALGSFEGSTSVTITGSGFLDGATVMFVSPLAATRFGRTATNVEVVSSTTIAATTPGSPGHVGLAVDVAVINPDGQSARRSSSFTYFVFPSGIPLSVTAISPRIGITAGGTQVKLTGSGFHYGTTVTVDGVVMRSNAPAGDEMYFTTQAHTAGVVDLVVRNPDGESVTLAGGFVYATRDSLGLDGSWEGPAGHHYEFALRLTVQRQVVTSVSCGGTSVIAHAAIDDTGRFSVAEGALSQATGQFLSDAYVTGTINLGPCTASDWYAIKK